MNINAKPKSSNHKRVNQSLFRLALSGLLGIVLGLSSVQNVFAQSPQLKDNYPNRYTVVEGDTLWGISSKFLSDPWRWPEVWKGNPQVENPDLIFPGDVLILTFIDGQPVLKALRKDSIKLSPKPRATKFSEAIPVIDPAAITAYINSPLVTDVNELEQAGYILEGMDRRLIVGQYDQFYARGINSEDELSTYRVFRPGRTFRDPVSEELLGYEAIHVGDANMLNRGEDVSRLVLTKTHTDAGVRDRLRPVEESRSLPFFFPKPPENEDIRGSILITENEMTELGAMSIVAINLGEREGVQNGDVLRILSQQMVRKDPITGEPYKIPEEKIGLALVFRTFEKVSYAIITDSSRQVTPGDTLVSPVK